MADIIQKAILRIQTEVNGKSYFELDEYHREIPMFLVTIMTIKIMGIESVTRKYSLFEAMRAEKFLSDDLGNDKNMRRKELLLRKIFEELFGVRVEPDQKDPSLYKIKITDYLKRATPFHEEEWKLINRLVHGGYVFLDAEETVRLFRSELSGFIYNKVKNLGLQTFPEEVRKKAEELRLVLAPRFEYRVQAVTDFPPCVKHALEVMNKGENLPHSARVMLATYMLAVGKPTDEIVEMFKNAPDFNERITRYQVEHLAGTKGSRTKYSVPSCDKLRTENLCFATAECAGIINPIQFGRRRKK